jgi:hypothetical protein
MISARERGVLYANSVPTHRVGQESGGHGTGDAKNPLADGTLRAIYPA